MVVRRYVFDRWVDEKGRSAEAVVTGRTCVPRKLQMFTNIRKKAASRSKRKKASNFVFHFHIRLWCSIASLRTASWLDNLETFRSSPKCFFTAYSFFAVTHPVLAAEISNPLHFHEDQNFPSWISFVFHNYAAGNVEVLYMIR